MRFRSGNEDDWQKLDQILSYSQYKMKQLQQLEEKSETLVQQMASGKRDAWLNIYNNFLDYRDKKYIEEGSFEDTIRDKNMEKRFAAVRNQEDFYELFRNWEQTQYLPLKYTESHKLLNKDVNLQVNKEGLKRKDADIDMEKVEEERRHMAITAKQKESREIARGYYNSDEEADPEVVEREEARYKILQKSKFFEESVEEERLQFGKEFDAEKPFKHHSGLQEFYEGELVDLEKETEKFEKKYDVKLNDGPINIKAIRNKFADNPGQFNYEKYGMTPLDALKMLQGNDHSIQLKDIHQYGIARKNLKLIDDQLIRNIEAHLAGVPRASEEFGIDFEYLAEKEKREKQVFDVENYEAYKQSRYTDGLDKQSQQQQIIMRMKQHEVDIHQALAVRENQMLGLDDMRDMKFNSREEFEAYKLQQQLRQAESRIKRRFREQNLRKKGLKISSQELLYQIQRDSEHKVTDEESILNEYIMTDKFGQFEENDNNIDSLMQTNACKFKDFKMPQQFNELQNEFKQQSKTATPIDNLQNSLSSQAIIDTAQNQKLNSKDQKLASLYQSNNPMRENYLRAKYQMYINEQLRSQFASKILLAQYHLKNLKTKQNSYFKDSEKLVSKFNYDVSSLKGFDFIMNEQNVQKQLDQVKQVAKRIQDFDPDSRDIQNYNEELRMQLQLLEDGKQVNSQIKYIIQKLKDNKVVPDACTHELLFKASVFCDENLEQTNIHLANSLPSPMLQTQYLEKFFNKSIQEDNYDSLANLINYIETHGVDISQTFDLNKFRSSLDFYLNYNFDVNKLLTFTRFYVQHVKCAIKKSPDFQSSFGKVQQIVDMNALFSHLVDKIGTKTLLDPTTKTDPMMNIIDFYTEKNVQEISKQSEEGTTSINESDIAKYLVNHDIRVKNIIKLDSDVFVGETILNLKQFHQIHKSLPKQFTKENVKMDYLDKKDTGFSEKTAEYFLYLFKTLNLQAETIDLCENWHKIIKGYNSEEQAQFSEIRNYYMSQAILSMDGIDNYNELIEKAVYKEQKDGGSYIVSMTKAFFKDGNTDHALKFFNEQIEKRQEIKLKQEDELICQFDSTFGEGKENSVDKDTFKQNYLSLMMIREKANKELKAVEMLENILQRCDEDEIKNVFIYQLILKEEEHLLKQLCQSSNSQFGTISQHFQTIDNNQKAISKFINVYSGNTKEYLKQLQLIKDRKSTLEEQISNENKKNLLQLINVMDEDKVELMDNITSLDDALKVLGLTKQDYNTYKDGKSEIQERAIYKLKEEYGQVDDDKMLMHDKFIQKFNKNVKSYTQNRLEKNQRVQDDFTEKFGKGWYDNTIPFDQENFGTDVTRIQNNLLVNPKNSPNLDEQKALKKYRDYLYFDPIKDEEEPEFIKKESYYITVQNSKDNLFSAIEYRKEKALKLALNSFNKIQNLKLKSAEGLEENKDRFTEKEIGMIGQESQQQKELYKQDKAYIQEIGLSQRELFGEKVKKSGNFQIDIGSPLADKLLNMRQNDGVILKDPQQVNALIEQIDDKLNNKSSPIISNFLYLMDYKNGNEIISYNQFVKNLNKTDDDQLDKYILHAERMEALMKEIDDLNIGMKSISNHVSNEIKELKVSNDSKFSHQLKDNKRIDKFVNSQVDSLYAKFQNISKTTKTQNKSAKSFTREQKLELIQQALNLEFGSYKPFDTFNQFYKEDLIAFGIQNDIAEAVGLGEKLMAQNDESMSYELAKAVKTYSLNHNQRYRTAIKRTGPITNNPVLYKSLRGSKFNRSASLVNVDDPYWQNFFARNYRHQDRYLLPSIMAWDYNENGIMDEIFDPKMVEERRRYMQEHSGF